MTTTKYIYLVVISCGASVLAVEMAGTRLLAPFYGADIYLWSALISVTLAALSVGYAFGGRLADRDPRLARLASIVGAAGVWIAATSWMRTPLLALTEGMDMRLGVLTVSVILFFPPLMLLGMVSPFAIRLTAEKIERVGTTSGNLYAISTISSVVAALATGFILIPNMGVKKLFFFVGLALVAVAAIGLFLNKQGKSTIISAIILLTIGMSGVFAAPNERPNPEAGLLAVTSTPYGDIRVVDKDDIRYMLIDGGTHSSLDLTTNRSTMPYVNVCDLAKNFFPTSGRVLVIGVGGGSVITSYVRDGWDVTAVEIDPAVTRLAAEFFKLDTTACKIVEGDGRRFLTTPSDEYNVIIVDAYGSSYIPPHLASAEAFALMKTKLSRDGILAINIQCVGWHDRIVASMAATLGVSFDNVIALPIAEPPDQYGNLVLMASDRQIALDSANSPPIPTDRFSYEYDRAHAWDNQFKPDLSRAIVFTDDLNPVDSWSGRINYAWRKSLHQTVSVSGLAW